MHKCDAMCSDSRGPQYWLDHDQNWLSQYVEHSVTELCLLPLKSEFCGKNHCSCQMKLNASSNDCWLLECDAFLILSYELYIFVDIMKHVKIVIYIWKHMYSIYFRHVYFFITSTVISKLFLIQSTQLFCVCVCVCVCVWEREREWVSERESGQEVLFVWKHELLVIICEWAQEVMWAAGLLQWFITK